MALPRLDTVQAIKPTEKAFNQQKQKENNKRGYVKIPKTEMDIDGRPKVLIPVDTRALHKEMLKYLPIETRIQPSQKELDILRKKQREEWAKYEEEQKVKQQEKEVL